MQDSCKHTKCNTKNCVPITDLVNCNPGQYIAFDSSCDSQTVDLQQNVQSVINSNIFTSIKLLEDKNGRVGDFSLIDNNNTLAFQQLNFREQLFTGWLIEHTVNISTASTSITTIQKRFNTELSLIFSVTGTNQVIQSNIPVNAVYYKSQNITINNLPSNKKYAYYVTNDIALSAYSEKTDLSYSREQQLLADTKSLLLNQYDYNKYNFTFYNDMNFSPYQFVPEILPNMNGLPNVNTIYGNSIFPKNIPIQSTNRSANNQFESFLRRTAANNFTLKFSILIITED